MAELCKHLPFAIVEQYRRGAYARYAINSMEGVKLHGAARVKTIIDKGGRCTANQTRVNSNYVPGSRYARLSLFLRVFGIQN